MSTVEKVTISLPAVLLARIEDRRRRAGTSRSETIADLLWRAWCQVDAEEREERYRAAYQVRPETRVERAWAEWGAEMLAAQAEAAPGSPPGSRAVMVVGDADVWWAAHPERRCCPVLLLSWDSHGTWREDITVAVVTTSERGLDAEVPLTEADGMPEPGAESPARRPRDVGARAESL